MNRIAALIIRAYELAIAIGTRLLPLGPTLARFVIGYVFLRSGWGKLHDIPSVVDYFTELGLPAPHFQAVLASTSEFVCGSLLLAGFATRFAVVPLIVTMTVAIRTALWPDIDSLVTLFGKAELLYIAMLVWLGTTGPGPFSIDHVIERVMARRSKFAVETRPEGSAVVIRRIERAAAH